MEAGDRKTRLEGPFEEMLRKTYEGISAQIEDQQQAPGLQIVQESLYLGKPNKNAQRLCKKASFDSEFAKVWKSMKLPAIEDEQSWKRLTPKDFKEHMIMALCYQNGETCGEKNATMAIACALLLWKSGMVETRGMKFVFGMLIRKLHEVLDTLGEISEVDLENVLFILLGVHNTGNRFPDRGSRLPDMERIIHEVLSRECKFFFCARDRATLLANEDMNKYRGPSWSYPEILKRNPSEILAALLRVDGDVFTMLQGGLFTLSMGRQRELDEWRTVQKKEWQIRTSVRYAIDKDGWYYRTIGWRSLVVYLGTLGVFVISLVITVLDLGEEGRNVFKRTNFFCDVICVIGLDNSWNPQDSGQK